MRCTDKFKVQSKHLCELVYSDLGRLKTHNRQRVSKNLLEVSTIEPSRASSVEKEDRVNELVINRKMSVKYVYMQSLPVTLSLNQSDHKGCVCHMMLR